MCTPPCVMYAQMYEQILMENERLRAEVEHLRRELEEARTKLSLEHAGSTPLPPSAQSAQSSLAPTATAARARSPLPPSSQPDHRALERTVKEFEEELQVHPHTRT